jgi:dynein heavy chain
LQGADPESSAVASAFLKKCEFINESLDESLDNMKFLDGIKRQVEICVDATDFYLIRSAIKKVMKSLRHAWMLSKYYNTDEKIVGMLRKMTVVLLFRVKNFVRLEELSPDPHVVLAKASNSVLLLDEWQGSFHKTKSEIERSEREKRWEFSTLEIFSPIKHAKRVCRDMIVAAMDIANLNVCFSDKFESATEEKEIIREAKAKVQQLVKSFSALTFDIFSNSVVHHWENHLNWFKRESRFLEVKMTSQAAKMFARLRSAKVASEAVREMLLALQQAQQQQAAAAAAAADSQYNNQDMVIRDAFVQNFPKIVDKFISEIKESRLRFVIQSESSNSPPPPIASDMLPPISGAICWANGILTGLDETLDVMRSIENLVASNTSDRRRQREIEEKRRKGDDWQRRKQKWEEANDLYTKFSDELSAYKQKQYEEWCAHVSDILSQNLTR